MFYSDTPLIVAIVMEDRRFLSHTQNFVDFHSSVIYIFTECFDLVHMETSTTYVKLLHCILNVFIFGITLYVHFRCNMCEFASKKLHVLKIHKVWTFIKNISILR